MNLPIRILLITTLPAPYRIPVFNALAACENVCLRVLFLAESAAHRAWPEYWSEMCYKYRVLPEITRFERHGAWTYVSRGFLGELRGWPDVVVTGGWNQPLYLLAFLLRRVFNYKFGCWVESTERDERRSSGIMERVKKRVVAGSDVLIVPGSAAERYVCLLGGSPERIIRAPNAVDNKFFSKYGYTDRSSRDAGPVRFLYVGRLHPLKGINNLLDAWRQIPAELGMLVLVGDGPLRSDIERRLNDGKLERVDVRGHLDRDELAEEYAASDVFVFPSLSDPWGLVLNEAMAAGLPVITTNAPGAVDDLIADRVNGLVVPTGDPDRLAAAMLKLGTDRAARLAMGRHSFERIQLFSPARCAEGLVAAARTSIEARS